MKKYLFILAAAAALLASCKPSEYEVVVNDPNESNLVTISVTARLDDATRATIDDSAKKWVWAEGDQLAVFDGVAKRTFDLTAGAGTSIATFTGSIDAGAGELNAVFPYAAAGATYSEYTIPAEQTVTAEAVADPAAMVATATGAKVSEAYDFNFSSAVSFIRFSSDAAGKFIFHAVKKEDSIAGKSRAVVVNAPAAGSWWVAVNPAEYTGIRVFRRISGHDYMLSSAASLDLSAPGKAKEFGTINSTANEVAVIENADELISYLDGSPTLDAYVVADLDLTAKSVKTCATYTKAFDGQNHSICNWTSSGVALFGAVNAGASVNNLTLDASCSLTNPADGDFGFMVKHLKGSMVNCVNKADVSAIFSDMTKQHVFSILVGRSSSKTSLMTDCVNYGSIDIEYTTPTTAKMETQYFGGIVGLLGTETDILRLSGCRNEADHISVTVHNGAPSSAYLNNTYVGGLVGGTGLSKGDAENPTGYAKNYGTFSGCINNADVSVSWEGGTGGYFKVGGLIGACQAQLLDCINNGDVSLVSSTSTYNANPSVGGLAGVIGGPANPNAKDCTNNGTVTLSGSFVNSSSASAYAAGSMGYYWANAGGCFGIVGDSSTLIDNCDCNAPVNFDIRMSDGGGSGHCLGGIVGICQCAISNCDHNYTASPSIINSQAKNAWLGGIVGLAYNNVTNCTTNAPIESTRKIFTWDLGTKGTDKKIVYLGGIVGRMMTDGTSVSGCTNSGTMTLTTASDHGTVYLAGIVSYSGSITISNCTNSNTISFDGGGETGGQVFMAGILGWNHAASTFNGCSSTGNMNATNWANTSYSYIGGIASQYNKGGNTITDCTHNADITITASAKLRVGGIAAANNGTFTGNTHSGDITATGMSGGAAAGSSQVGGLVGYWGAGNIVDSATRSCSTSGAIITKLGSDSRTGGVVGSINVNSTWTNLTVNSQVTTTGSEYVGALVGGFHSDGNLVVTLAGSSSYTGTTVNGSPISSGNILGFANNTGSISGYSE